MSSGTGPKPRLRRDEARALRQQALVLRNAQLRGELAGALDPWRHAAANRSMLLHEGMAFLRRHPGWPLGLLAAAVVVFRPARLLRLGLRLWGGWRLWQQVSPLLQPGPPRAPAARGGRAPAPHAPPPRAARTPPRA